MPLANFSATTFHLFVRFGFRSQRNRNTELVGNPLGSNELPSFDRTNSVSHHFFFIVGNAAKTSNFRLITEPDN
jgi:hypothetical protein